ncbi:chemotaxis protein CheW [uncultured Aureimonas sp.]|uniref:ATP-binding protein n=1 Tax=uncultured Aureimonas sp. TaxID=1604662 RepID=UPI0025DFA4CB|nr:chemotaxis protein CheW [uncultured Aureimonas sp.]
MLPVPPDADPAPASPAIRALEALNGMVAETSGTDAASPDLDQPWQHLTGDRDLLVALLELLEELLPTLDAAVARAAPAADASFRDDGETLLHALTRLGLHGAAQAARRLLSVDVGHRPAAFADLLLHARRLARIADRDLELPADLDRPEAPGEATETSATPAAPPGLFEAPADIRAAVAELPAGTALAECPIGPLGPEDVGPVAAALAREPAVLAARLHAVDSGDGLAVLARAADFDPAALVAGLGLSDRVGAVMAIAGDTPSRLFGPPPARPAAADETQVRVPIDVLDRLFGRVGEFFSVGSWLNVLVFDVGIGDVIARLADHAVLEAPELLADIERLQRFQRDIAGVESEVNRLVSLIHESTLGLRVIPLDSLMSRFPRMIRDTARETGKSVRFGAQTGGIRIDKGMSEMLADPLMHMIRNAVDHGIEPPDERRRLGKPVPAILRLDAVQTGNRIAVTLSDDGRGIDIEAVRRKAVAQRLVSEEDSLRSGPAEIARFIFSAGFSTADAVSAVSGRGVGMDVALVNVTKLGGTIDIDTRPGAGTSFRLDMPLSAAIQPMLLVETAVQAIGLPETMVREATVVPREALQSVNGQPAVLFHGQFLPVYDLAELLRLPGGGAADAHVPLVVCEWQGQRIGLAVRRILRRHEMLIRETHPRVARLPGIGGVTTLGFDRIVLVADPDGIVDLARRASTRGLRTAENRLPAGEVPA